MSKKYAKPSRAVEKSIKNWPRAPVRSKEATKCLKIWGLKKVTPESIFELGKRHQAAQAPTVGFWLLNPRGPRAPDVWKNVEKICLERPEYGKMHEK